MPHTGTQIPEALAGSMASLWLARRDADWWIERLYQPIAEQLDATVVRTDISRSVIDMNRDPSGASLYPGQQGTGLCPLTTFDGEPLYRQGMEPGPAEVQRRLDTYFTPYHRALRDELARLRALHPAVVLYDCHSIRSTIPMLFDGILPLMNIGTFDGRSCAPELEHVVHDLCVSSDLSAVLNQRFKGGWITRHFGDPANGVHAVQMELACRGYMPEPHVPDEYNWPTAFDAACALPMLHTLERLFAGIDMWLRTTARASTGLAHA